MSETLWPTADGPAAERRFEPFGERRRVAVLFCDMQDSTRLSVETDPEELQNINRAYEQTVKACILLYGGWAVRLEGDGALACFGYPVAHENNAEQAVRAGLAIVEALRSLDVEHKERLKVRIGIAAGMVIASAERGPEGEVVNRAARLSSLPKVGSFLVDEEVRRLVRGTFACIDKGAHALKGFPEPVRTYLVTGLSDAKTRFEAAAGDNPTPFVGRQSEIDGLERRWELARSSKGRVVLVAGEPGIGKSRIVRRVRDTVRKQGGKVLGFQCSEHYRQSAFYPITVYLERALNFTSEKPQHRLSKLEKFIRERKLPAWDASFIASALSLPYGVPSSGQALTARRQKEETLRALVDLVAAEARDKPMLILFEDVHWADPSTLEVLDLLIRRAPRLRLLALLTTRPELLEDTSWPEGVVRVPVSADEPRMLNATPPEKDCIEVMDLSKLTHRESGELVSKLIDGKTIDPRLLERIIEESDGFPLFLEELTNTAIESGHLPDETDSRGYADISERPPVPSSVYDSLRARLDRLGAATRLAHMGAAIGREFSYELIRHVALPDMPETELNVELEQLERSGLAFRRGKSSDAVFRFKHALVQDIAYDTLLKSQRPLLHAKIAGAIEELLPETRKSEPELLAHHYKEARRFEKSVLLWLEAGQLAWKRYALNEAISHLNEGLALLRNLPESVERDRLELELRTTNGPAIVARRGWADSRVREILEPAWKLATQLEDRQSYLRILNTLWVHNLSIGKLRASLQWAEELLKAGAAAQDDTLTIVGHRAKAGSHFWLAEFDEALVHGDIVRKMYSRERHGEIVKLINTDPFTGEGIYRAQYRWMQGYVDEAVEVSDEKDRHAEGIGHPFDRAFALTLGAQAFGFRSEADALLQRAEKAERVAGEARLPLLSDVLANINRGIAAVCAGHAAEGVRLLDESLKAFRKTGHGVWIWYLAAVQAEGLAMMGRLEEAIALVEENLAHIEKSEDKVYHAEVLRIYGSLLARQGKLEDAERTLRKAIDIARKQKARSWELRAATELARLLIDRRERKEACELLARLYAWFESTGKGLDTRDLKAAKALLDALRVDRKR